MWLVIGVRVRDQFLIRLSHRIWFSLRINNHLSNSGVQDFSSGYTTWISPEGKDINVLPPGSEERAQQITTFCSPAWQHKHSPTGLAFTKLFSLCWSSRAVRKTQQPYLTHPLPNRKSNKSPSYRLWPFLILLHCSGPTGEHVAWRRTDWGEKYLLDRWQVPDRALHSNYTLF